ncbi:hypothetical protein [Microvirga rosea]|uniref:hypothetical protein n=1 Tax=Microvirga rosea TaxID=2715425 RepID=UPI001D0A5F71|nr:hypothetical protein [Microvirga rosea]MCB8823180.1 hypothetical protein [Microvirga rosea]
MTENRTLLCQTEIRDWRIADGSAEDLIGRQSEDWLFQISHSDYGGLTLTPKAPDGTKRLIDLEIDQGNAVIRSYRGDEPDAKMIVAADATYVSSCSEVGPLGRKLIRYESEDADFCNGEVPANMTIRASDLAGSECTDPILKNLSSSEARYTVVLDTCGNPDRGQDPSRRDPGAIRKVVPIEEFATASKVCRGYIEHNDRGSANWTAGEIQENGQIVGKISCNGTVWPPGNLLSA